MSRHRLPNRRLAVTHKVAWDWREERITIGYDDQGRAREVFASGRVADSKIDAMLIDTGIVLSLALQYGIPISEIAAAVGVDKHDPNSIIGAIIHKTHQEATL
ncbi:MAG: hypothetical protein AAF442_00075 [Pseudomonadota bacterium]